MKQLEAVNDFVIKFANINGSGSASANLMFAKSIFRMGVPVSPRNIFPSNIQGLPTWYEVRVNEKGYLGARGGVDFMVAMNSESMAADIASIEPGGYLLYDSTRELPRHMRRDDITLFGVPLTEMCNREYNDPRQRQLFKNIIYVGALAALLDIDTAVINDVINEQFKGKEKLVIPNIHALDMGRDYALEHFNCPIGLTVKRSDQVGDKIFIDGNSAAALGCVYGGATFASWYPITPSSSLAEAFGSYCEKYRIEPETDKKRYAMLQAEDELAAIGMVIGAGWNGSRAFTATSGPGISLMSEFLGLAYFAEIPSVIFDVQRTGPSTGMPTRTQQSDILACAYASHGDTKHLLLIPNDPFECFELSAQAFDLADHFQTPVIVITDLDIGMNDHITKPFEWDDARRYNRGKIMTQEDLDAGRDFGRYLDVDGDGVCYRTYPGTHPERGSFFTRGTSRDPYARYTEDGKIYAENMRRLDLKFETAARALPAPVTQIAPEETDLAVIYYGSTSHAMQESLDQLADQGLTLNAMRLRAFPFSPDVKNFIDQHSAIIVVEQNRDAQMRTLLINELEILPEKLMPVTYFEGSPITAKYITAEVLKRLSPNKVTPLRGAQK